MVDKIITPPDEQEIIDKINELVDASGSSSGLYYADTCPALTMVNEEVSWSITHNLNSTNVSVSLYTSTGLEIIKNVTVVSVNVLTVTTKVSADVSAGDLKVVILAGGASGSLSGYANISLSNLTTTSSNNFDGQWIPCSTTVFSEITTPVTDQTFSLSSILPNDSNIYEVLLYGYAVAPADTYFNFMIGSSITSTAMFANNNNTGSAQTLTGNMTLPVGTDRNIVIGGSQWYSNTITLTLILEAYRRVGTNA